MPGPPGSATPGGGLPAGKPGLPPMGGFAPPKPPLSPGGSNRAEADGMLAEQGGPALFKPASMRDASAAGLGAAAAAAQAQPAPGATRGASPAALHA